MPALFVGVIEKSGGNIQWNGINVSAGKLSENWNREVGEQVSLYTYTNGDEVELFLNGKSLGVKKNRHLRPAVMQTFRQRRSMNGIRLQDCIP